MIAAVLYVLACAALGQTDWRPPSSSAFPPEFLRAANFLHTHGMADPRGGKPVRASTPLGIRYGWLISEKEGILAGTDGVEYRGVRDWKDADLLAKGVIPPDERSEQVAAAMFLIQGNEDVAAKLMDIRGKSAQDDLLIDYLQLRFKQECAAFEAGDDRSAIADADWFTANLPTFQAQPEVIDALKPLPPGSPRRPDPFYFVKVSQDVETDAKRRLASGEPPMPDVKSFAKLPQKQRIAKLIEALEFARPQGMIIPGGPVFFGDPILDGLVKEGVATVEPLLDAYENDKRLTRNPLNGGYRPTQIPTKVISVSDMATVVLWETELFDAVTDQTPAGMRTYWKTYGAPTAPQVWFNVLAANLASNEKEQDAEQRWMIVARHMLDPLGTRWFGPIGSSPPLNQKNSSALQGDPLRNKRNPSVTELLARRVKDLTGFQIRNEGWSLTKEDAMELASLLVKWDPKHAMPALQMVTREVIAEHDKDQRSFYDGYLGSLMATRIKLGDETAAGEYVAWIKKQTIYSVLDEANGLFAPLIQFPANPLFLKLRVQIFRNPNSLINPTKQVENRQTFSLNRLMELPEYLEEVEAGLRNKREISQVLRVITGRGKGQILTSFNGPNLQSGDKTEIIGAYRVCDVFAKRLSQLEGAPRFDDEASALLRDAAIIDLQTFLHEHRSDIHSVLPWPANGEKLPRPGQTPKQ